MYAFISGKLVEKNPANVVIDANGIGYMIHISLNTFSAIGNLESVKLYTHLAVREDAHLLYGFFSQREKELFLQLISVSGVGANTARMILSALSTDEAIDAIATGKATILQSVKGIGTKTAQRIVIDLRDKVGKTNGFAEKSTISYNTIKEEALSGLIVLGFNKVTADKMLEKIIQLNPAITVERLIKEALKAL